MTLSSPPVAGVWWAHTLDWLYDSLSSPPVAGVWWAHTLDWLYDSLSSPPVAGAWWAHTLDWLYDSLSSPPVAGVWWVLWHHCPVAAVASSKWMLHTGGDWGETPHMVVKRFGCTAIVHSFIHFNFDFTGFSVCIYVPRGIAETATRAPPQLHKTPPTREKAVAVQRHYRMQRPAQRLFTRDAANGRTEVALALRSRGGRYHKSPNDATLQLFTPKREQEHFFNPPLLAANYINANISGVP